MSYIQIDIGGRLRGIKFSQGTNILLQDRVMLMDEDERKAFGVPVIIWAGLKTNCVIKGERFTKTEDDKEVSATFEDVCEWCEKLPVDVTLDIVNLYSEVNPVKEDAPDDEKKNQPENIDTEQNVTNSPVEN
jgi:hypothetical protein